MPKLGFHVSLLKKSVSHSISYFHKLCNISAFQLFLKSPKQKGAINIKEDEYIKSKKYIEDNDLFVVSHSPYIINIASSDEDTINSNIQYAVSEINAISKLGGKGSVYHVGKSVKLSKEDGFNYMCNFIKKVLDILIERQSTGYFILETGAGCGTGMGTATAIGNETELLLVLVQVVLVLLVVLRLILVRIPINIMLLVR
jgi:deoxyribonuclease-4